jgi:DNA-binding NarL/FixJ family response regulator
MPLAGAASGQAAKPAVPAELPDDLTAREAGVLKLRAAGLSNGEIARARRRPARAAQLGS